MVEREGLSAGTLMLELAERAIGHNPELVRKVLQRIKRTGVSLACVEYGLGNSDLATLAQLPFDTIKIDPGLLDPADSGDRQLRVLQAVVKLAHDLELSVVAEGIETEDHAERLADIGCDYGEGYHIGPPVTAKQVTEALGDLPYSAGARGSSLAALLERLLDRLHPVRGGASSKEAERDSDVVLDVTGIMPSASARGRSAPGSGAE
jgi:predicted signal transduction protein with EAL and GGDEF domain